MAAAGATVTRAATAASLPVSAGHFPLPWPPRPCRCYCSLLPAAPPQLPWHGRSWLRRAAAAGPSQLCGDAAIAGADACTAGSRRRRSERLLLHLLKPASLARPGPGQCGTFTRRVCRRSPPTWCEPSQCLPGARGRRCSNTRTAQCLQRGAGLTETSSGRPARKCTSPSREYTPTRVHPVRWPPLPCLSILYFQSPVVGPAGCCRRLLLGGPTWASAPAGPFLPSSIPADNTTRQAQWQRKPQPRRPSSSCWTSA